MTTLETTVIQKGGKIAKEPFRKKTGTPKYVGIKCQEGHYWETQLYHVIRGSWCPHCYGNSPDSLQDLKQWAESLGGHCLSEQYNGMAQKYNWYCGVCGTEWAANWANVKHKFSWCPGCCTSLREEIVRSTFEECFPGKTFPTNRTVIGMELDGYCAELSLAFEHDGVQHREHTPYFQRDEEAFDLQLRRDRKKDERCEAQDICLIRIPDRAILAHKDIRSYVRQQLKENNFDVPEIEENWDDFCKKVQALRVRQSPYLEELKTLLEERGEQLQSDICPTRQWEVRVLCGAGHTYTTHYDNVIRGRGCPDCAHNRPKTMDEVTSQIEDRGYRLINTVNKKDTKGRSRKYITVQCAVADHDPVEILWDNFRKGRGCLRCGVAKRSSSRKNSSQTLEEYLRPRDLEVVGGYTNNHTPTTFRCISKGHRFTATIQSIRVNKANIVCFGCNIANLPEYIELQDRLDETVDVVKTVLHWRCNRCGAISETTYRGMMIRKHKCANKKCDTRR